MTSLVLGVFGLIIWSFWFSPVYAKLISFQNGEVDCCYIRSTISGYNMLCQNNYYSAVTDFKVGEVCDKTNLWKEWMKFK